MSVLFLVRCKKDMEYKPIKQFLKLRFDTLQYVYKSINFKDESEMEDAIKLVREWLEEQPHFRRKDFTHNLLRANIIISKGSIEVTKQRLDKMCTLRTLMPDHFKCFDAKKDFENVFKVIRPIVLPQLSKDHFRVFTVKVYDSLQAAEITQAMKYTMLIGEYMKQCDCIGEYIGIFDLTEVKSIVELIKNLNLMDLRKTLTVLFEGHGMRLKGIYFVTTSKVIDTLIGILKQVLKPKIIKRIKVFKTWEEIYDLIGREIIPADFGGYEKTEKEIHDDWIEALSEEGFKKYFRDISSAGTVESCRPNLMFSEEYAGLPGTFRLLSVD